MISRFFQKKNIIISFLAAPILFTVTVSSANADFFDTYEFMSGEWREDQYVYFGGCEQNDNQNCIGGSSDWRGSYFSIGADGVRQGVYQVKGPNTHDHGKFVLQFDYMFLTEETTNDNSDVGIMKLKDVSTNQEYFRKEVRTTDAKDEWMHVRVLLSPTIAQRTLQLVFETVNDDADVSILHIDNIQMLHKSQPIIRGYVYKDVAGKRMGISNKKVLLKNPIGSKTLKSVTTNADGYYEFFPVKANRKRKIVVTHRSEKQELTVRKLGWGRASVFQSFVFD